MELHLMSQARTGKGCYMPAPEPRRRHTGRDRLTASHWKPRLLLGGMLERAVCWSHQQNQHTCSPLKRFSGRFSKPNIMHYHSQRFSHNACEICASHSLLGSSRPNTLMAVPINTVPSHNVEKDMYSATVHTNEKDSVRHVGITGGNKKSFDEAYDFLRTHDANRDAADLDIKRIRRKIDYWILPLFYLNYLLQFLDKSLLGFAIIMGLEKDLGLKGNELNNIASSLWWRTSWRLHSWAQYLTKSPSPDS